MIHHGIGDAIPPSLPLSAPDHDDVDLGDRKMEGKRNSSLSTQLPWRDTSSCICSISECECLLNPFFLLVVTTAVADIKTTTPSCEFVPSYSSAYTSAPCPYSSLDVWEQSRRR